MLREVVHRIGIAVCPVDAIHGLSQLVTQPVPLHVPGFPPSLFDVLVYEAGCRAIVRLERDGLLRVTQFL